MSTNVSVPEKIYATELYGNHLMDLSELPKSFNRGIVSAMSTMF